MNCCHYVKADFFLQIPILSLVLAFTLMDPSELLL